MKLKSLFKTFAAFFLSIFLTPVFAFAQESIDRRPLVHLAFENFTPVIQFLSCSERFLELLTPEERKQFELVGHIVVPHIIRFDRNMPAGYDATSKHINFKLKFSSRSDDFKLNPGEPERTAKVSDDVWFNLNIINNAKSQFNLLDAFQILFHEFGHKVGAGKDQVVIDQVAAKIRTFLQPFYREQEVVPGQLKASTLLLPQIMVKLGLVDMQPDLMVLLEMPGRIRQVHADALRIGYSVAGYTDEGFDIQAYRRMTMTPQFSIYDNALMINWTVEMKNILVAAQSFFYMSLFTNVEKAKNQFGLEPMTERKTLYQFIQPAQLASPDVMRPIEPSLHAENKYFFLPEPQPKWAEPLKLNSRENHRLEFTAVIQSASAPTDVALIAQISTRPLTVPGEVEHLAGEFYKLRFSLPDSSSLAGKLLVTGIALNGKSEWALDEELKVDMKPVAASKRTIEKVEVWDGEKWVLPSSITSPELQTDRIRFRYTTQDNGIFMNHLMVDWVVFEQIFANGKDRGLKKVRRQELISANQMKQTRSNGKLIIEFESKKMSRTLPGEAGRLGITTQDNHFRAIEKIELIDQRYEGLAAGLATTGSGWKNLVQFVTGKRTVRACGKVHGH